MDIKVRLGKLDVDLPAIATAAAQLPLHHNDPIDVLLISKALAELLKPVTADALLVP